MGRVPRKEEGLQMHKHWVCSCGYVVHGDSDDQIVETAQDHMRRAHGKEVSREEVLKVAKEHRH